jgi:hypothetical protein
MMYRKLQRMEQLGTITGGRDQRSMEKEGINQGACVPCCRQGDRRCGGSIGRGRGSHGSGRRGRGRHRQQQIERLPARRERCRTAALYSEASYCILAAMPEASVKSAATHGGRRRGISRMDRGCALHT